MATNDEGLIERAGGLVRPVSALLVVLTICTAFLVQVFKLGVDVKDVFAGALGTIVGIYFTKREVEKALQDQRNTQGPPDANPQA